MPTMTDLTAPELLERVLEGNRRWAEGDPAKDYLGAPEDPLLHQPPVAVIGCSDARVMPAAIFGAAPGAIFTLRLPGHYMDIPVAAGMGFAVSTAGARLAIVLGHEDCRAVDAAFTEFRSGTAPDKALAPLSGALAAGLYEAGGVSTVEEAVDVNARHTAHKLLAQCPALRHEIAIGRAQLAVLRYSPATKLLTVLEENVVPERTASH
jgi:carbonic anhydrase